MYTRRFVVTVLVIVAAVASITAEQDAKTGGDQYVGVWSGSWDGGGSGGGFTLTVAHEKDKPLSGTVAVTGEPEYTAALTSISFDGAKMTAKYDFTPEPAAEVVLTATFSGDTATGTWSLREKASGNEALNGGWKVKRGDKK